LFFQHLLANYSPTSLRTVASNIRSFLRFTDNERLLRAVPSHYARRKPIIPILSEKEVIALKDVLQSRKVSLRDKAIILLSWHTGLRACDIVKIRMEDIDWINDTISIVQSKTGTPLILPLIADVGNALSTYILNERVQTRDDPSVFLRTHAPYTGLSGHSVCYAIVRRAFASAGIRAGTQRKGTHLLRHSAASRMLAKGVPITTISSMLGHSDKSSTDAYLSTDETRMRECALGLAKIPMNCGGLA
jgi:integrase